jgi:hypothetical protein
VLFFDFHGVVMSPGHGPSCVSALQVPVAPVEALPKMV